jgi:uncharacterized protein with HEPN domain
MSRDQQSIIDIVDSINLIFEYTQGVDWQAFQSDTKNQDAVIRRLTIIGEATKRLSTEFRTQYLSMPWKQMRGLRDVVVHNYDDLKLDVIRDIIELELPSLL